MAAIGSMFPTLVDIAKRTDPGGAIAQTVEMLAKANPILQDMAWKEGNLPTGHRFTSRTALPSVGWRRYNQGVAASKSQTVQVDETCGMLEGFSNVDVDLANLNANAAAFRSDEDKSFVESFNIEVARAIFYESTVNNPDRIHGLTPRLDSTTGNPAAAQLVKADTSASGSDQASIWFIGWGEDKVFGIFPKGSTAGLHREDLGKRLVLDATGKEFLAYTTHWQWKLGLCVRDSRYVVRVCNIDTSRLTADASSGADLPLVLQDAIAALHDVNTVSPTFYMNRAIFSWFNKQLLKRSQNFLEYVERGGRRVPHFLGFPITVVDALVNTESVVV